MNGAVGQVISGTSANSVSVETSINGSVVEQYQATSSGPIEYRHTSNGAGNGTTSSKVSIHAIVAPLEKGSGVEASSAISSKKQGTTSDLVLVGLHADSNMILTIRSLRHFMESLFISLFKWD